MFCFGHTQFEMHISYEVSMLRQLAVQVWNSQKREPRAGDKNLGGPGEYDQVVGASARDPSF